MAKRQISDKERQFVADALQEFLRLLEKDRKATLTAKKANASGTLSESYDGAVDSDAGQADGAAAFGFEEYGRWLDMKKIDRRGARIPVSALVDWIEARGLDSFKRIPVQRSGKPFKTRQEIVNRLAWGIAVSVQHRGNTRRRRVKLQAGIEKRLSGLIKAIRGGAVSYIRTEIREVIERENHHARTEAGAL